MPPCVVQGCPDQARGRAHGLCERHYGRRRRTGALGLQPRNPIGLHSEGYLVLNGQGEHPLRQRSGPHVYQHRDVLFRKIGPGEHPCHWCGRTVSWEKSYPKDRGGLTVDHVDGNKAHNVSENLVPACGRCNLRRTRQREETSELTAEQIAEIASVGVGAVHWWRRTGLLPPSGRAKDGAYLFDPEAVRLLMQRRAEGRRFNDESGRVRLR